MASVIRYRYNEGGGSGPRFDSPPARKSVYLSNEEMRTGRPEGQASIIEAWGRSWDEKSLRAGWAEKVA